MNSNEKFIETWKKEREKGKFKSILRNILNYTLVYWIVTIMAMIFLRYNISRIKILLPIFFICITTYTITSIITWNRNEEKYKRLLSVE